MNLMWFLRMSNWVRNPPSLRKVLFIGAILGACLVLVGIEYFWGWPDWLTLEGKGRVRVLKP